jgi:hypothetical protein
VGLRQCTPTLSSYVVFTFKLAFQSFKEFGGASIVNATEDVLFSFYIFRGGKLKDDYIKLYKHALVWQCRKEHVSQPYFEESVRVRLTLPKWGLGSPSGLLKV